MAQRETVKALPVPLPESVEMPARVGFTPNEQDAYHAMTGTALSDLDERAAQRALIWVLLRRAGHDVTLEAVGDVQLIPAERTAPDPTVPANSQGSPRSVTGGT